MRSNNRERYGVPNRIRTKTLIISLSGLSGKLLILGGGRAGIDRMVAYTSGSKLYREEPDEDDRTKYRTECWLERVCMRNVFARMKSLSRSSLGI